MVIGLLCLPDSTSLRQQNLGEKFSAPPDQILDPLLKTMRKWKTRVISTHTHRLHTHTLPTHPTHFAHPTHYYSSLGLGRGFIHCRHSLVFPPLLSFLVDFIEHE